MDDPDDTINEISSHLPMPRLVARSWTLDLATAAFKLYGDPIAMRFMRPFYPLADLAAMRERLREIIERNDTYVGRMGSWPLFKRDTDAMVGVVLLKPLPESEKIEVGWHLLRTHWGHGYATEAGRAALVYGFEQLRLETIYAVVNPGNTPSIRVCQRLNMRHLGRTSDYYERELEFFLIDRKAFGNDDSREG
ncbi:MAG: GNAT family N-acetyltransferase [Phycisphaerales bacterium]|nr:GNAT family N-acetyltransferase [Phycisphaerales bacterium]